MEVFCTLDGLFHVDDELDALVAAGRTVFGAFGGEVVPPPPSETPVEIICTVDGVFLGDEEEEALAALGGSVVSTVATESEAPPPPDPGDTAFPLAGSGGLIYSGHDTGGLVY